MILRERNDSLFEIESNRIKLNQPDSLDPCPGSIQVGIETHAAERALRKA